MNDRPTPETDAVWDDKSKNILDHARRLERERDEAREAIADVLCALEPMHNEGPRLAALRVKEERDEARATAEKAKAYKRVMKEDNAQLRRELDDLNKRLIEVSQRGVDLIIERDKACEEFEAWKEARK